MTQLNFLKMLFDEGDKTCLATNKYDTALSTIDFEDIKEFEFATPWFSINAMLESRADKNVLKHRTFLLEFDKLDLRSQFDLMNNTDTPITAGVYSGGKSNHYFITLQEPVTALEYSEIAQRLHIKFPEADKTTKNPSRFARLAGVIRPDTGKLQECFLLNKRVALNHLLSTLPELPIEPTRQVSESFVSSTVVLATVNPEAVMSRLGIEGRNQFFFWLGQRLIEANMSKDERRAFVNDVYAKLQNKSEFPLREARMAARV